MTSEEHEPLRPTTTSWRKTLEALTTRAQETLALDFDAQEYLGGTGLIQLPDGREVQARGLSDETLAASRIGLVGDDAEPGFERYEGKLLIPYLGHDGRIITVRFRRPEWVTESGPKYLSLDGDVPRIYGIADIHQAGTVLHVTEGELDRLILKQIGWHAVAIPGAAMWSGIFRNMLKGFSTVVTWFDGDEAGAELTRKVHGALRQAVPARIPRSEDVNSLYLTGGADALHELAQEALNG